MEEIKNDFEVGTLVRWDQFPDRIYYIKEDEKPYCGHMCFKIETVDHKWTAITPKEQLTKVN